MNRPLVVVVIAAVSFVIGSATTVVNVFPGSTVKRSLQSVGIGRERGPANPNIGTPIEGDVTSTKQQGLLTEETRFKSKKLEAEITVLPGVFNPYEAENAVLEMMQDNAYLFEGATVMEIGTGSGIISLYAAKLGATQIASLEARAPRFGSREVGVTQVALAEVCHGELRVGQVGFGQLGTAKIGLSSVRLYSDKNGRFHRVPFSF